MLIDLIKIAALMLAISCSRQPGEGIKEIECPQGQTSFKGTCVRDLPELPTRNYEPEDHDPYGTSRSSDASRDGDSREGTGEETEEGTGEETEEGTGEETEEGTGDGMASPTTPPSGTPEASSSPADLIVKVKIDNVDSSKGISDNPYVLWISFQPNDQISNLSVSYKNGTAISGSEVFYPADISAEAKFNYKDHPCTISKNVFSFVDYYKIDPGYTGREVDVKCGGL